MAAVKAAAAAGLGLAQAHGGAQVARASGQRGGRLAGGHGVDLHRQRGEWIFSSPIMDKFLENAFEFFSLPIDFLVVMIVEVKGLLLIQFLVCS